MTLSAWVRPVTLSGWRTAMLKEATNGLAYALYAHDNLPQPAAYANIGGGDRSAAGTAALALNTWSHLAATYDGTTLRLFVNGTQVSSQTMAGSITASTGALRIGGNTVWGEYFAGLIDEVRIYNRALTAAETHDRHERAGLRRSVTNVDYGWPGSETDGEYAPRNHTAAGPESTFTFHTLVPPSPPSSSETP